MVSRMGSQRHLTSPLDHTFVCENPTGWDVSEAQDGANFHGTQCKNDTHQSTTDPDAKLYRKSSNEEPKLSYLGHTLGSDAVGRFNARVRGSSSGDVEILREKRWDIIETLALPSLATLSGTCYRGPG